MEKRGTLLLIIIILFYGCSSTQLREKWLSPHYETFNPENILIIGVTPDVEVRNAYEEQLKNEFYLRNIKALKSTIVFEDTFKDSKQTETEIENQIQTLLANGYDTIIVSAIKGIKEKKVLSSDSPKADYHLRKFKTFYFLRQNEYFDRESYTNYKVYTIETSIYNIKNNENKSLVWHGVYDIVDPKNTKKTINNYVKTVIKSLEKEHLIPQLKK